MAVKHSEWCASGGPSFISPITSIDLWSSCLPGGHAGQEREGHGVCCSSVKCSSSCWSLTDVFCCRLISVVMWFRDSLCPCELLETCCFCLWNVGSALFSSLRLRVAFLKCHKTGSKSKETHYSCITQRKAATLRVWGDVKLKNSPCLWSHRREVARKSLFCPLMERGWYIF